MSSHYCWAVIYGTNPMFLETSEKTTDKFSCARSWEQTHMADPQWARSVFGCVPHRSPPFPLQPCSFRYTASSLWGRVGELTVGLPLLGREGTGSPPVLASSYFSLGPQRTFVWSPAFFEESGGPIGHVISLSHQYHRTSALMEGRSLSYSWPCRVWPCFRSHYCWGER